MVRGSMVVVQEGDSRPTDRLRLAADLDELPRVIDWLDALAARDGWPERSRFTLHLSLEEALVNAISYGFPGGTAPTASIELAYGLSDGIARITLEDNGVPFDPTGLAEPEVPDDVASATVGGHGVQLMRHLLDEFSYCHVDGHNRLILGSRLAAGVNG